MSNPVAIPHASSPAFCVTPNPISSKKQARSTAGCSNCKRRKIKCDETKPTCTRCSDRRLKCPGYSADTLKWSVKHEIHRPRPRKRTPTSSLSIAIPNSNEPAGGQLLDNDGQHHDVNEISASEQPFTASDPFQHVLLAIFGSQTPHMLDNHRADSAHHRQDPLTRDNFVAAADLDSEQHDFSVYTPASSYGASPPFVHEIIEDVDTSLESSDTLSNFELPTTHQVALSRNSPPSEIDKSGSVVVFRQAPTPGSLGTSISPSLLHIPTVLVEYYFRNVCRECSTFDSMHNPFRSTIAGMQLKSAPINHAIQSLAASKLADDMPGMRLTGIEAQGKALRYVRDECVTVNALHDVSDEVLCAILLLGMTTSWHVREDIGVEYLNLARQVIVARSQTRRKANQASLEFFQNALKYWTMIVSIVSNKTEYRDDKSTMPGLELQSSSATNVSKKVMPHPWTGVSPEAQVLFGKVLQLIRKTRGDGNGLQNNAYSRAGIASILTVIATAEDLEAECWDLSIPTIQEIADTEDESTPPIHHVLTARAYLLSALLHIYMTFPDVLDSRIAHISPSGDRAISLQTGCNHDTASDKLTPSSIWLERSSGDSRESWLRDIGLRIVECLECIEFKSGTRVVHPPLLLAVSSALTLVQIEGGLSRTNQNQHSDNIESIPPRHIERLNFRVIQCRTFTVNRLETMYAAMRFHAIDNILRVIKEVWRRSDETYRSVFWMDVMHELGCETLFG